ncbi:MAG TPA: M6 family metalloprotease domain-containing protein [candidate division WOR-3 bacterium]|uniref:M6 family metalloprotease domain-containing protein n=1 Tax=candidate division WOR-3 bacterium TaxID=2052148 RepID=A0A9C9EMY2_UNCW3|nr:M6 family metalloprotease domain-containing protein [candidate division WOR-3 bacterium]
MVLLILTLICMPPNPYADTKKPIIQPKFPALMNRGPGRIENPTGEKKALVILIDFNDNQHTCQAAQFDSLIYGESQNSLRDYYTEVSYGKFTISKSSVITQWLRAPQDYSYYIGDSFGLYPGNYPNNVQGIVVAACSLADPQVNFADFDKDGDGVVDALFIVHAGPGAEETGDPSQVWSHQWQLSNTGTGCPGPYHTDDGVDVDFYSMEPETLVSSPGGRITVGVFAHEFGHVLGLPDLYDRDGSTYGIGMFGLMAAGSWGRASSSDLPGSSPTHFCAWSKYQLGFVSPVTVDRIGVSKRENESVACAGANAVAYRLLEDPDGPDWNWSGGTGEYFLVENRYRIGFDRGLPGDGLLILHIDDTRLNNDNESHPLVGVMQADGDESFLLPDRGVGADLWQNSSYGFGDTSRPASFDYDGNPTGVWVYDIGPASSNMNVSFWVTPVLLGRVYSYPNPFRINDEPSWGRKVIISYVPSDTVELGQSYPEFKVIIYNIAGERVRVLDSEPLEIDRFSRRAFWDLKNEKGEDVVSGMYLYVIETEGDKIERNKGRMTIIR